MDTTAIHEEYIEILWTMFEKGLDSAVELKHRVGDAFDEANLGFLVKEGIVNREERTDALAFTEAGKERAALLIRSHRLAERLIAEALGGDFEEAACEFEHIKNPALVDSICTMLGHPRECPHGLPIPEGECCRKLADTIKRSVIPLTSLEAGVTAVIAYVYSKNDGQLHVMEGMQIRPGVAVKLHQKKPTYVIEVEDAHIAIDPEVAANIQVWIDSSAPDTVSRQGASGNTDNTNNIHGMKRRRKWRKI